MRAGSGSPVVDLGTVARLGVTPLKGAALTHPDRLVVHPSEVQGSSLGFD